MMSLTRLGQAWQGNGPPWNPLPNLPVWSWSVEVLDVFLDHTMKLPVPDNQQNIGPLSPQTPQEPFAERCPLERGRASSGLQWSLPLRLV